VEADENHIAIGIGERRTIIVGRVRVIVSRHYHSKTFALQREARSSCEQQHQILFYHSTLAARSIVYPAMRWVQHDYGPRMCWRWWRNLLGAGLCRHSLRRTWRRLLNLLR